MKTLYNKCSTVNMWADISLRILSLVKRTDVNKTKQILSILVTVNQYLLPAKLFGAKIARLQ
jgi:hypothetical protein